MRIRTLSAEAIASWEEEVGPSPIHGLALTLTLGGHIEAHHHARGQLMYASSGVMVVSIPRKSWVIGGPRGLWVPESIEHEVRVSTSVEMRNLQICRRFAPSLPNHSCVVEITPLLRELVAAAISGPNYFGREEKQGRVLGLILDELQEVDLPSLNLPEPRDPRIKKVCAALRDNPGDQRTLECWAAMACASSRTLERLFVQETGLTFANWRRQARLINAVVQLTCGDSVTSVALDAGYETTSGFIDMFKRQIGCTPGQYVEGGLGKPVSVRPRPS